MPIKNKSMIIAHRGESYDAPENSLSAIDLAWKRGARAVEIDIQLTLDNEIVVIHDYDTLRVSAEKKVIKYTNLKDLKALDIGLCKGPEWKGEKIPTLREVLDTIPKDCKLIIEIKSEDNILEKLNMELSKKDLQNSQIEIIAFDIATIAKAKQMMPQYKMLWLLDLDYYWYWWFTYSSKQKLIEKIKSHNLDGVDVWAGKLLNYNFIKSFNEAGLLVYGWTINNGEKAKTLIEYGIDGITTDRAQWMTEQLCINEII